MHKIIQKKASDHLCDHSILFFFVDLEVDRWYVFDLHFDDVKTIWQFDSFWQFVIESTLFFRFCHKIKIEVVCFNDLHEFVLKFVCVLHAFTKSIQTLCKVVELFIDLHFFFKVAIFFTFESEFVNFCVGSF